MLGRHRGFIKYLKEAVPGMLTVHCVIYRQNLVAKNISGHLHHSLSAVIRAVNTIKARAPIPRYSNNYVLRMMRNLSNYYCIQKIDSCPKETA